MTLQPRFQADRAATIKVPKGHVWVEGDNATQSVDSRQIGAVPASLVLGRAFCIVRVPALSLAVLDADADDAFMI